MFTARVFFTSQFFNANFAREGLTAIEGRAAADELCQAAADSVLLNGEWISFLGTPAGAASGRLRGTGPWVGLADAGVVFLTPAQVASATATRPNALTNEQRVPLASVRFIWTGTATGGNPSPSTCSAWSTTLGMGTYGGVGVTTENWNIGTASCGTTEGLLCFEQAPTANLRTSPSAPAARHRLFVTSALFAGNLGSDGGVTGLAAADQRCAEAAQQQGLGGAWAAFLTADGTSPLARVAPAEGAWLALDGGVVFPNLASFRLGKSPASLSDERGVTPGPSLPLWTGSTRFAASALGLGTCVGWTSAAATDTAVGGVLARSNGEVAQWGESISNCATPRALLCVER